MFVGAKKHHLQPSRAAGIFEAPPALSKPSESPAAPPPLLQLLQGAGHGGLVGAFTAQDVLTGEVAANLSIDEIRAVLSAPEQAATVGRVRELYELFQLHNVDAEARYLQQI